jgi:hypothetical protein
MGSSLIDHPVRTHAPSGKREQGDSLASNRANPARAGQLIGRRRRTHAEGLSDNGSNNTTEKPRES